MVAQRQTSYLEQEIGRLKITAAEAVEHAHHFTDFKKYLHVERPIQREIEKVLRNRQGVDEPHLLLLCGSVGDGKSHLLAYLNDSSEGLLSEYKVFNDATESARPEETALETLEETFKNFSDEHWETKNEKIVIAINLGVLHKFIMSDQTKYTFDRFKETIRNSGIFDEGTINVQQRGNIDLVSFAHYQIYDLLEDRVQSDYLMSLLQKVCIKDVSNPFYAAYKQDEVSGIRTVVHENFDFLGREEVQHQVVQLMCRLMIERKVSISSRHFLDFLADIIVPLSDADGIEQYVPSLLYNNRGRSDLLDEVSHLHPIHARLEYIDQLMVRLHTSDHLEGVCEEYVTCPIARKWLLDAIDTQSEEEFFHFFTSTLYLTNRTFAEEVEPESYKEYVRYLHGFNVGSRKAIRAFYAFLKQAIFNWKEQPKEGYVYVKRLPNDIGIAQELELSMSIDHLRSHQVVEEDGKLRAFAPYLTVAYEKDGQVEMMRIDYALYTLLDKVVNGYRPNKQDREDAVAFVEYLERLMGFGEKEEKMLISFLKEKKEYELKLQHFGDEVYYEMNRIGE